jgi:hypothetical protein
MPGHFGVGGHTCTICPAGKFSDVYNQEECTVCANGTFAIKQSVSCSSCAKGQFHETTGASCKKCSVGTFQAWTGKTNCDHCAEGKYQDKTSYHFCHNCTLGRFSNEFNRKTPCTDCVAGQYQPATGKVACKACAAGKFGPPSESGMITEVSHCKECPEGKWQGDTLKVFCHLCGKGTASAATNRSTACDACVSGTYQTELGETECTHCGIGKFHSGTGTGAISEAEHCEHCPNGKYQQDTAQLDCTDCPSGKYTDSGTANHVCTACLTRDADRYWWTENAAGWDKCVKHPLDCKQGAEGSFDTCTKSCKKTTTPETYGDKKQYSSPVYHAWGGGVACSAHASVYSTDGQNFREFMPLMGDDDASSTQVDLDGTTEPARKVGKWEHKIPCNLHYCPIDCVVSEWSAWATCSKSCATGSTTRSRTITTPVSLGGKICPTLGAEKVCNPHKCHVKCNSEHATCKVVQWAWKVAEADRFPGSWHGEKHSPMFNAASGTRSIFATDFCKNNTCLDANPQIHESIEVLHHRKFSSYSAHFKCALEETDETKCTCMCDAHPTGCYSSAEKWAVIAGTIDGNIHPNVANFRKCSDMCTTHPSCTHWQHITETGECTLLQGPSTGGKVSATVGTYAGVKNMQDEQHNTCERDDAKVVVPTQYPTQCRAGKYVLSNSPRVCDDCPAGKFSAYANQPQCFDNFDTSAGL